MQTIKTRDWHPIRVPAAFPEQSIPQEKGKKRRNFEDVDLELQTINNAFQL